MNTKTVWIVLIAVLLIAIAAYAFSTNRAVAPSDTQETASSTDTSPAPEGDTAGEEDGGPAFTVITLTDSGFSPATVTVRAGETVRFVNESSRGMWVGSDDHPTHTEYDGTTTREHCADGTATNGTFDQCASVPAGSFWDYTFERAGTFGYHNHVGASNTGTVVVQ